MSKINKRKQTKGMEKRRGFKPRVPRSLVVFYTNGSVLHGMVARCAFNGTLDCSTPKSSRLIDGAAVAEVLGQLREHSQGTLPKIAILISPSATSEVLELPIDPKKSKLRKQMKEAARWDLEEVLVRQNDIWSIGSLLQGRGHVTVEQRLTLESAQRFGSNIALYRDEVERDALDECIALQESLIAMDDELMIGGAPMEGAPEGGRFRWLCSAMSDGPCAQWVAAFKKNGIHCSTIYPQLGAGWPLVQFEKRKNGAVGDVLLVDVQQEQFGLFSSLNSRLNALSIQPCSFGQLDAEQLVSAVTQFIPTETQTIILSAPENAVDTLTVALRGAFKNVEVKSLPCCRPSSPEPSAFPPAIVSAMEGVARVALKCTAPGMPVGIVAQPPKPPLWKSKEFWPWAIMVLLAVGFTGTEISIRVLARERKIALEDAEIEFDQRKRVMGDLKQTQHDIRLLEEQLAEKKEELAHKESRIDMLEHVIRYRQKMVPGLLQSIASAIPQGVLLDALKENANQSGFLIEAWAINDTEAQRFGSQLNNKLTAWNYKVSDIQLVRGKGRLGVEGYILKIKLVKTKHQEATDA